MCGIAVHLVALMPLLWPAWSSTADRATRPTIAVTPSQPMMDDRLGVTISGLPPERTITVRARSRAHDQRWWRSAAVFTAGPDGKIDLGAQAPAAGSYRGADAMGLFWSMQPDAEPNQGDPAFFQILDWFAPVVTELEVACENRVIGSVTIERRVARPDVRRTEVRDGGIVGFLYEPSDGGRHPGVIVLGGSEGGFPGYDAAMLASRGFAAMSLAYFGAKGLPATLQNIPIEYFGKAIRWMRARPGVEPDSVALLGASRGAEAALMAAAVYPEVKAVVAVSPTHARWEGLTGKRLPGGPAWTYGGTALPYIANRIGLRFAVRYAWDSLFRNPISTTPLFLENLADSDGAADVEIPVESIQGPILLLSGKDDQVWPSSLMADRVMARLRRNGHPYRDGHLSYEEAGHWLPSAHVPTRGLRRRMKFAIGGTAEGAARAQADSWPRIMRFLAGGSVRLKSG